MKKVMSILFTLMLLGIGYHSAEARGDASATMNVSVTVIEPSQIQTSDVFAVNLNGSNEKSFSYDEEGMGKISIPSLPESEMIVSISGDRELTNSNGSSISFDADFRIGRNVKNVSSVTTDSKQQLVSVTNSDNGGYRAIVELELFGTLDANEQREGTFLSTYTVTTEHL